jgi:hypothetical protein
MTEDTYQQELKAEWLEQTKNTYTVQCAGCGRFAERFDDIGDKITLYCGNCDCEHTINYLSMKNVNRTNGKFLAVWHNKEERKPLQTQYEFTEKTGVRHKDLDYLEVNCL